MGIKKKKKIEIDEDIGTTTVKKKRIEPVNFPINGIRSQEDDYQEVLERLDENTRTKTWIGVPVFNEKKQKTEIIHKTLKECTSSEFAKWINQVYPPAKSTNHNIKDYETQEMRERVFMAIVSGLRSLQFPKAR